MQSTFGSRWPSDAEYRSGDFALADAALISVATGTQNNSDLTGTAAFLRAMSLFQ
ncbi:MAG TPA: hypothetical protein VNH11_05865 [Pirellulales bacterium]|nr:hypothetical protein [Pirellulales bacterium]